MRGLKPIIWVGALKHFCRIFYRCVDWNFNQQCMEFCHNCRIFYRCVDWNTGRMRNIRTFYVASFTDAWIETPQQGIAPLVGCRIFYRCVDWNKQDEGEGINVESHLLQMRGLKPRMLSNDYRFSYVASFTDAWIETPRYSGILRAS